MRFPEGSQVIYRLVTMVPNIFVDGEVKEMMNRPNFLTVSIGDTCSEFKENNELSLASALSSKAPDSRQVSFGKLEVRYYPIILGDHPDCSEGPPVTIDWDYDKESVVVAEIDTWEQERPNRLRGDQLLTSWEHRFHILKKVASTEEIIEAMEEVERTKKQREHTVKKSLPQRYELIQELSHSLGETFKRLNPKSRHR